MRSCRDQGFDWYEYVVWWYEDSIVEGTVEHVLSNYPVGEMGPLLQEAVVQVEPVPKVTFLNWSHISWDRFCISKLWSLKTGLMNERKMLTEQMSSLACIMT